jgi:trimethylamine:corrinoid methyltransferase-like protein
MEAKSNIPGMRLEILSSTDLDAIHAETLKVLEETGTSTGSSPRSPRRTGRTNR